jgi:uncharacterized lipoprotein YajG
VSGLRPALLIVWCLAPSLAVSACGTATPGLDVGYPAASAHQAMLASVSPRRVQLAAVADRRADPSRIGVKPTNGEALVTARPVPEILREALAVELAKNGHVIVADEPDVVLAAQVDEFWLDVLEGHKSAHYIGRIAIAVTVSDGRTGTTLVTRRYVGIKRREGEAESQSTWREVMDAALVRAMRDAATDHELVAALARTTAPDRAQPAPRT